MSFPATMALSSLCLGCLGVYLLVQGHAVFGAACHFLAAYLGYRAALLSDSRRLGRHIFQAAVAFCVPFMGGCTSFFLSEAVKRKKTGTLSDEFAVYLNDAASFRESVPVCDCDVPSCDAILPLADVLANPVSQEEQRIAVENLASMETPAAMGILRKVIDSDSGEGRFFAMTALAQMEEKLLARLQRQEEDLASGREGGPGMLVAAARTYIDFSYFQLAQDSRRAEYLARAGELLEQAEPSPDAPSDVWILLGRVRLLQFDAVRAREAFDRYLERYPENQAGYLWRAEAWYQLGDYLRVREDCRNARRLGDVPANIRGCVDFWLGDEGKDAS